MRLKRSSGVFFGVTALLLLASAIGWACTPSAYLYPVAPSTGTAGAKVTVRGGQFGDGPVEIRWATENGRLLATTLGPDFSTKIEIPSDAKGVHTLVAIARDPQDRSRVLARRAEVFEVTGSGKSTLARSAWDSNRQSSQPANRPLMAGLIVLGIGAAGAFTAVALGAAKRKVSVISRA